MKKYNPIVHTWMFSDMPCEKMAKWVSFAGAQGIDLSMYSVGKNNVAEMQQAASQNLRILEDAGLSVQVVTPMFFHKEIELCNEDAKVRQAGVDFAKRAVDAALEYGAKKILISPSWITPVPVQTLSYGEHLKLAADSMQKIAEYAAPKGVDLMIEPVNRYRVMLIHTVGEALRLINMIDADNVHIVGDVFHMHVEETEGVVNAIHQADQHLSCLHIGDNTRRCPGYGAMDWRGILSALDAIDFGGALSYEPATLYFDQHKVAADEAYAEVFVTTLKNGISYLNHLMELP